MLQVKLDTGFNIEVDFLLAPFIKRFLAWVLDVLIILAYYILVSRLTRMGQGPSWELPPWLLVLLGLPPMFYHLLCEVFLNGQSIGKKALHIKVISADGGQPSVSQYIIRWLFRVIDFPIWIFLIIAGGEFPWWTAIFVFGGVACLIATPYSQRIGDVVAGTLLIDTRNRTSWEDTIFTELTDNYQPRYPQVMQLSDKDINTLKGIISAVRKKSDYDLSIRIAARIRPNFKKENNKASFVFLRTLLGNYIIYSTR